jgi:hypothetical protein
MIRVTESCYFKSDKKVIYSKVGLMCSRSLNSFGCQPQANKRMRINADQQSSKVNTAPQRDEQFPKSNLSATTQQTGQEHVNCGLPFAIFDDDERFVFLQSRGEQIPYLHLVLVFFFFFIKRFHARRHTSSRYRVKRRLEDNQ